MALIIFVATQKPAAQPETPAPAPPVAVTEPEPAPVETAPTPPPDPQPVEPAPPVEASPAPETAEKATPQKVAVALPPVPSAPKEGAFQLTTSPVGAKARFDTSGIECTTPCNLTLPAGRHVFVLRHAGYRETQKIISIPNDTGLIVDLVPMTGTLNLITESRRD